MTRTYLVLFRELPLDKTSVKSGRNHPLVITAARSVNVALFLSNAMRRDVSISLGFEKDRVWQIVTFPGARLRRVSPDERSITFFLLKAFSKMETIDDEESHVMNNGIVLEKVHLKDYVSRWMGNVFVATEENGTIPLPAQDNDSLFIYEVDMQTDARELVTIHVHKPRTPERFILDVNMICDTAE